MKQQLLYLIVLTLLFVPAFAKVWVLSSASLVVEFDDQMALVHIKDKRCNTV